MIGFFCFLSLFFVCCLACVAYQDWKNKYITLWSFYLLNLLALFFLFTVDDSLGKYWMLVYFVVLVIFDLLELLGKRPKFLNDDWMIGNTGFYDYWFYLFLIVLFVDFMFKNFISYYIGFSLSILLGGLIAYFLTKKRYSKSIPLFVYAFFILSGCIAVICLLK